VHNFFSSKNKNMRNKILFVTLMMCSGNMAIAQTYKNKMSDTQKTQAAKADVYLINSKRKIIDSLTTSRDTIAAKTKKKSSVKGNKKSS
jgi:hypothetical protein